MSAVYEDTTIFCEAFLKFEVTTLYQMLSPHCRMQNKYGNTARGVNGSVNCIRKLYDIQVVLMDHFKHKEFGKHQIYEMSAHQSLAFMFSRKGARTEREFSLGFSLEWECSVVTGIVFNCHLEKLNVDSFVFLMYCNEDSVKVITDVLLLEDEAKELATAPNFTPAFDFFDILNQKKEVIGLKTGAEFSSKPVVSPVKLRDSMVLDLAPGLPAPYPPLQPLQQPRALASVSFEERTRVVLTPKMRGADIKNFFFTNADFRRFQRDKTEEIEQEMQVSNVTKEQAMLALYQESSEEVGTNTRDNGICSLDVEAVLHPISLLQGRLSGGTDQLLLSPHMTSSLDDDRDREDSLSSNSSTSGSLSAPRPRRLSMDDEVDRDLVQKQQLDKDAQWQQFHVSKLREFSSKKDSANKKKVVFPPRGFVLKRYLPPPKVVQPTVVYISLLRCQDLTPSIFWPLVSTDSYVVMIVDGERQSSEIVRRKRNPKYNSTEVYTFALEYESTLHSYITFEVYDESRTGGEDALLGTARVAFAALQFQPSPRPPQKVVLPLSLTREALECLGAGRGFFPEDLEAELRGVGLPFSKPVPLEKQKTSCLSALVSVVDATLCANFEALRMQDAATEARVGRGVPWVEGDVERRTLSSDGVLQELAW